MAVSVLHFIDDCFHLPGAGQAGNRVKACGLSIHIFVLALQESGDVAAVRLSGEGARGDAQAGPATAKPASAISPSLPNTPMSAAIRCCAGMRLCGSGRRVSCANQFNLRLNSTVSCSIFQSIGRRFRWSYAYISIEPF